MNNDNKKDTTNVEVEKKFKDAVFNAFASKTPGVHMDEDGFIVVPMRVRKKKSANTDDPR